MKNRIFLIAVLLSVLPFLLSGSSFKAAKKSDIILYCGGTNAACPPGPGGGSGPVDIVIGTDGTYTWIQDLSVEGVSIGYGPYTIVDHGGGQFTIDVDLYCMSVGKWHYNGIAFGVPCP